MTMTRTNSVIIIRRLRVFAILALAIILQACQDRSMNDLREFVDTAYQDQKPDIEPLPEIIPFSAYEYSALEDDDPFAFSNIVTSQQTAAASSGIRPDANRRKEALEQYPLDALRMVGTMTQQQTPWVIVMTSEGTAHRATIGNYMGQQDGKIQQIIPDEQKVVLAELVLDPRGQWVTREVEITIDE